ADARVQVMRARSEAAGFCYQCGYEITPTARMSNTNQVYTQRVAIRLLDPVGRTRTLLDRAELTYIFAQP
ncbi:uncharacterized protein BXZ73DRAFT_45364, partial [Epithele typhae]|uniref:uncharacterized protein n=1 Tax=Epithele typhae TaxID=378194 RepID=UPI0020072B61